jgi:hypothetical protein
MKAAIENLERAAVEQQCRALRLPAVAEQCAPQAEEAVKQRQTYLRYLEALLAVELEERERNTIARRIKDVRLPRNVAPGSDGRRYEYRLSTISLPIPWYPWYPKQTSDEGKMPTGRKNTEYVGMT